MKEQFIRKDSEGNTYYYSDKEMTILHREDGEAFVSHDGRHNEWWLGGENLSRGAYAHRIKRINKNQKPTTLKDKEFMVIDIFEIDMCNGDFSYHHRVVFSDEDYDTTRSWAMKNASPKAIIAETVIDKDDLMTKVEYGQLLDSGMLWKLYPDWYGTYSVDILGEPKPE